MAINKADFPYDGFSELKVLRSGAGYYIGRQSLSEEGGIQFVEPGTRESGYFPSEESARDALRNMDFTVRDCMENNSLYASGVVPRPKVKDEDTSEPFGDF